MITPVSKYYILLEETEHGPFSIADLKGLLNDQIANLGTPAREEGDSDWRSISEILSTPSRISMETYQPETSKAKTNYKNLIIGCAFISLILLFVINYQITRKSISKLESKIVKFDNAIANDTDLKEIEALKNEVASLKSEISTLQDTNKKNSAQMKRILENYEIHKKFLSDALNKLLDQYSLKLGELTKTFEDKNNEIEKNLKEISMASKSIEDTKNNSKVLNKNHDLLAIEIKSFKVTVMENIGKLDAKVESCEDRIKILSSSLENLQRQLPNRN